jgi:hypothetical protein
MSSAFRAALFLGREWGKPQARFDFGRRLTTIRRKPIAR